MGYKVPQGIPLPSSAACALGRMLSCKKILVGLGIPHTRLTATSEIGSQRAVHFTADVVTEVDDVGRRVSPRQPRAAVTEAWWGHASFSCRATKNLACLIHGRGGQIIRLEDYRRRKQKWGFKRRFACVCKVLWGTLAYLSTLHHTGESVRECVHSCSHPIDA